MASFNKFQNFVVDVLAGNHDGIVGDGDTLKVYLSNATPDAAADAVKADLAEISAGNGYSAGGIDTQNAYAASTGTITVTGTNVTWTASGGSMNAFRYVVLYNDTPTSPADPLIGWWDYGSALTLAVGETFTVKFNNGSSSGTMFTLA